MNLEKTLSRVALKNVLRFVKDLFPVSGRLKQGFFVLIILRG